MQRLLDGWVVVAAVVIYLCCASLGALAADEPQLGSWRQGVLTSPIDNPPDPEPPALDPAATIGAMRCNNQNVRVYDVNTTAEWMAFEAFLIEADARGIDVYAALQKMPDPASGSFDRTSLRKAIWLGKDAVGDPIMPAFPPVAGEDPEMFDAPKYLCKTARPDFVECGRDWMLEYLESYVAMAAHLSAISRDHPALKGMVIDDFDSSWASAARPACLYGHRMRTADVAEIYDACKVSNPDFEFWPVVYPERFGEFLATDGHILGAERGVRMNEFEFAAVDLDVRIPPLMVGPGTTYTLQFTHADADTEGAPEEPGDCAGSPNVWRRVLMNKAAPADPAYADQWPLSIVQPQSVRVERFDVTDLIDTNPLAANTITFRIDAGVPKAGYPDLGFNGCGTPWWQIWDVQLIVKPLRRPPVVLRDFDATYRRETSSIPYGEACKYLYPPRTMVANTELRCPDARLPDDPINGLLARRIVAGPTGAFSKLDVVDGVIACFYRQETTDRLPCVVDGEIYDFLAYAYDAAEFGDTIDSLNRTMDGKGLAMILWSTPWPVGPQVFDADVLESQIGVSGTHAPMTLLFAQPLGLEFLDEQRGVFFDPSPTMGSDHQFTARWPSGQPTLDGWYQQWTIDPWDDRETQIDIHFEIMSSAGLGGLWQIVFLDEAGEPIPGTAGAPIIVDGAASTVRTITSADAADGPITLRFELIGQVGNTEARVQMLIRDDAGVRMPIDDLMPVYETGVSDVLRDAYNTQRRAYRALGCVADFDCDGVLTLFDFLAFQNAFDAGEPAADFDGDGALTIFDFLAFFRAFDDGC